MAQIHSDNSFAVLLCDIGGTGNLTGYIITVDKSLAGFKGMINKAVGFPVQVDHSFYTV